MCDCIATSGRQMPAVFTPSPASIGAALATATQNPLCTVLVPWYLEIGNAAGKLLSLSFGQSDGNNSTLPNGTIIDPSATGVSIASSSKWIYATYVVQRRGGYSGLTQGLLGDIGFLHFASGYSNMGTDGTACAGSNTIAGCLAIPGNNVQTVPEIGKFHYDSGHMENHAGQNFPSLAAANFTALASTFWSAFGIGNPMFYSSPLLAGGLFGTADQYTNVLRNIVNGTLLMSQTCSCTPICTFPGGNYSDQPGFAGVTNCPAVASPIPERWQYSLGHWIETDAASNGDGAFSSPGAYGTYPWIDRAQQYYGILLRSQPGGSVTNGQFITQQGYASARCGRLIRRAFFTGIQQTGTLPV